MNKKSVIFIIISIIITLFIFSSSLKDANVSSEESGRMLAFINSVLSIVNLELTHAVIRKLAHFTEFLCLGASLSLSGYFSLKGLKLTTKYILPIGFSVGIVDELLQFIPIGRTPMVRDVFIDSFGILTGYILVFTLYILNEKRHFK